MPFSFSLHLAADVPLESIAERMAVREAVQQGDISTAIERVNDLNPEVG